MEKSSTCHILRWARTSEGYTQREVAEKIGVRTATISEWETCKRPVPIRKLARILELLGINPVGRPPLI